MRTGHAPNRGPQRRNGAVHQDNSRRAVHLEQGCTGQETSVPGVTARHPGPARQGIHQGQFLGGEAAAGRHCGTRMAGGLE